MDGFQEKQQQGIEQAGVVRIALAGGEVATDEPGQPGACEEQADAQHGGQPCHRRGLGEGEAP